MYFYEILLVGLGLSMDAFAVSMSDGMYYRKLALRKILMIGAAFGIFQGLMPLIGYHAGLLFSKEIQAIDHWLALILLALIGGKMLLDSLKTEEHENIKPFSMRLLLAQSIATSIDALAVGISFAALNLNIYYAALTITITTFILSTAGVFLGRKIGTKLNKKAGIFGGLVLIGIGIKIFVEHVFF